MWPASIIRLAVDEVIPDRPITIKRSVSVAIEVDIISSEDECGGLVLISHWERMI